jgi:outer membrane protein OmpA-like peptidoglycan-associated protein
MFFGSRGQKNEIALTNGIVKIVPGLPDDIINSREDSEAELMDKPLLGKSPGDKSREDVVVTAGRPIRKAANLETAEISLHEGSRDQLKGKNLDQKKFLVYFRKESTELDSRLYETLTKIVDLLPLHPDAKIFIEGYTDSYGSYFYNKKISQLRANIVKSYFEGQGIAESRITAIGMGPENPIADNTTREGRSKNRRVEIRLAQ